MDVGLGVACVVYGGMVHVGSVAAISISYGMLLILGAVAGAIGHFSGACNRTSLAVSAFAGLVTCLVNVGALIAILVLWNPFIDFLKDNEEPLLLTEDSIKTIQGLKIPLSAFVIVLACLELYR